MIISRCYLEQYLKLPKNDNLLIAAFNQIGHEVEAIKTHTLGDLVLVKLKKFLGFKKKKILLFLLQD